MLSFLRTFALFALLLPALLVPRGLVVSMCVCGYGLDASVCVAQLGCADVAVGCACSLAAEPCAAHDDTPADGGRHSSAAHDAACPLCHTVSLDGPSIDFVACEVSDIVTPLPTFAPSFDSVVCAPPVARTARARGRAPPDGADASPGLWPGVRPLRI
jgi:hypothetical protein